MLRIWKNYYVLRRFKPNVNVDGYTTSDYEDRLIFADIQPAGSHAENPPEGKRTSTTISVISKTLMKTADARTNTPGDMLLFDGDWYQCQTSQNYTHTPLKHCTATFIKVTEAVSKNAIPESVEEGYDVEDEWGGYYGFD